MQWIYNICTIISPVSNWCYVSGSKSDKGGDAKGVGFISKHSCKSFGNHLTYICTAKRKIKRKRKKTQHCISAVFQAVAHAVELYTALKSPHQSHSQAHRRPERGKGNGERG